MLAKLYLNILSFFTTGRLHSTIGYMSPLEYELAFQTAA